MRLVTKNARQKRKRGAVGFIPPLLMSSPTGATETGLARKVRGRATHTPVPLVRATGGGDECRWHVPFRSGSTEPKCEKLGAVAGLDPQQHSAPAVLLRIAE